MADTVYTLRFTQQGLQQATREVDVYLDKMGRLRERAVQTVSDDVAAAAAKMGLVEQLKRQAAEQQAAAQAARDLERANREAEASAKRAADAGFRELAKAAKEAEAAAKRAAAESAREVKQRADEQRRAYDEALGAVGEKFESTFKTAGAVVAAALVGMAAAGVAAFARLDEVAGRSFASRAESVRAYETALGSAGAAEREYSKVAEIAARSRFAFAEKDAEQAQDRLLRGGARGDQLDRALLLTGDVASAARSGDRSGVAQQVSQALAKLFDEGRFRKDTLDTLVGAGVNREALVKSFGYGSLRSFNAALDADQTTAGRGGRLGANQAFAAVQSAVLTSLGTERVGQYAASGRGSTVESLAQGRSQAVESLLRAVDGESLPAVVRYRQALERQVDSLNVATESGQAAVMMLTDMASVTANVKTVIADFATSFMESFAGSFNAARATSGQLVVSTDGIKALGESLGKVGGAVGSVVSAFESLVGALDGIADALIKFDEGDFKGAREAFASAFDGPGTVEVERDDRPEVVAARAADAAEARAAEGRARAREEVLNKVHSSGAGGGGNGLSLGGPGGGSGGGVAGLSLGGGNVPRAGREVAREVLRAAREQAATPAGAALPPAQGAAPGEGSVHIGQVLIEVRTGDGREAGREAHRLFWEDLKRMRRYAR